ncbi:MAG: DUF72 domain-containing protein [Gammaproteobacteria bacterium]
MTNNYRIRFGTVGWQHPQWHGGFYPEDLPEEWLLPFYGNEFPVVAVPMSAWDAAPATLTASWRDNSDAHFRFVFEWAWQGGADLRAFCQRLAPLRAQTLGILLQVPWSVSAAADELRATLSEIATELPVSLEWRDADGQVLLTPDLGLASCQALHTIYNVNSCWHGVEDNPAAFFADSALALTKLLDPSLPPRALRQVLELCSAQIQYHRDTVVLFTGQPPPLQKVRDAMVMLELLA